MSDNLNLNLRDASSQKLQEKVQNKSISSPMPNAQCLPFLDNESEVSPTIFLNKTSANLHDSQSICEENPNPKSLKEKNQKIVQSFRKTQASSNEEILKVTPDSKNLSIEQELLMKNDKNSFIENNVIDNVKIEIINNKKNKEKYFLKNSQIKEIKKDKNNYQNPRHKRQGRAAKMKLIERFNTEDYDNEDDDENFIPGKTYIKKKKLKRSKSKKRIIKGNKKKNNTYIEPPKKRGRPRKKIIKQNKNMNLNLENTNIQIVDNNIKNNNMLICNEKTKNGFCCVNKNNNVKNNCENNFNLKKSFNKKINCINDSQEIYSLDNKKTKEELIGKRIWTNSSNMDKNINQNIINKNNIKKIKENHKNDNNNNIKKFQNNENKNSKAENNIEDLNIIKENKNNEENLNVLKYSNMKTRKKKFYKDIDTKREEFIDSEEEFQYLKRKKRKQMKKKNGKNKNSR